ncbi:MAG TPA: SDR family oxidoreductase [Parafilimonas sp.]|nr:SDR family oxidoreductase [Parafilimonas sp.]
MKNDFYRDKVVVVTGGSSGIGLALAKQFAQQHARLILIARDEEKLQAAKIIAEKNGAASVFPISIDITDNAAVIATIKKIAEQFEKIDVVINCAGIMTCGRFKDQPVKNLERCLLTNYLGAVYISKAAWPWLKKSEGQLSFVSSVAGYMGLIGHSSYAPSKFAIVGLAECLRMEAKDDNIRVSVIYPPDTDTPMLRYERKHTLPESTALSKSIKEKSPDKVAEIYLKGLQQNKFEIYCDIDSRAVRLLKNNFPGLVFSVTQRIIRKARKKAG